ncbi:tyrosine-protein phosphatase [Agromyces archimandritae]|uniref:Tyrosine-protein phosphatase n=1 Tax=Agromyces archimandritae TaxID=2781962 RepID=A0A975FKK1_9MICO|nr:tyrosine-protein phosphatase [Agromyces archimandritae]QTX03627.1 tyrosine-protein phosphatase [Agromyces archimandritae]
MRILDWDGLRNVRDLGELPTPLSASGATVPGRIARGPRRELLTAAGWKSAKRWGLRSVIDLRCEFEIGRRPTDPDAVPPAEVRIVSAPTEDQDHPEFRAVCVPILDSPEYWQHNVRILPELVRAALIAVAEAGPGVLVHCSAGRDRTGMMSTILLANAGVAADDIVGDYELSVRAMAGTAAHGGSTIDRQASWTGPEVDAWLGAVTPFVRAFAADHEAVFDTLGVSPATRVALRDLLIA